MRIKLISIGNNMPSWINEAYHDYSKRLPPECSLELIEIPAEKRGKNCDLKRIMRTESNKLLAASPKNYYRIALDLQGKSFTTEKLAQRFENFLQEAQNISFFIGGPEGYSDDCLSHMQERWSLSELTFPHPMVRVLIVEQIYRVFSILNHHPYHK